MRRSWAILFALAWSKHSYLVMTIWLDASSDASDSEEVSGSDEVFAFLLLPKLSGECLFVTIGSINVVQGKK